MSESIHIFGGKSLTGSIRIQGSKNAFHKILGGCVRWPSVVHLTGVPDIQDAHWLLEQFEYIGGVIHRKENVTILDSTAVSPHPIGSEFAEKSSGTILFAGALLARFGEVHIAPPGGDKIGYRPIDYHLSAFEAMGSVVDQKENLYIIKASKLQAVNWTFPGKTVNGTVNALLAATGARESTTLRGCAIESDIENAIDFSICLMST